MEKIGPYQILSELGRGGMGVVYRGVDPVIGRHVAIKTLRPEDMGESGERAGMGEKLLREARSAGMLSHPSIVTIYQAGRDGDLLYIAMEFIDGANLADILAQGRLNLDATLKILRNAADALDYAHSKGVVHRDIKPGNLLLEPSGKVKIADFGIAKLNQAGVTKTTSSVGSPAYMSPEHVRAQSIDGRADQYSLGVVAHEMLTGRRPHDSDELTSLVFKVVFEPPDLSLLESHPKGALLLPIFARVLSKAADDRYGTCMDFCDALAGVLDDSAAFAPAPRPPPAAAPIPDPPPPPPPPAARPGRKLLIGGGALLAAAVAAGLFFAPRQPAGNAAGPAPAPDVKPTLPVLIQQPQCTRPADAALDRIHGAVGLIYEVNELGRVENVAVTKSLHPRLDESAKRCVASWGFKPATLGGKDVRSRKIGGEVEY